MTSRYDWREHDRAEGNYSSDEPRPATVRDKLPGEVVTLVVHEYGYMLEMDAGTGEEPYVAPDWWDAAQRILFRNARMWAEKERIIWTREPEFKTPPPSMWSKTGAYRREIYADYDDEGNGIGPVLGYRWLQPYGWYALGVKVGV